MVVQIHSASEVWVYGDGLREMSYCVINTAFCILTAEQSAFSMRHKAEKESSR